MATAGSSSSQVIETIHQQLICSICLERYNEPKFLSCLHTFCCQCLHNITNQKPCEYITCPTCREDTKIPENGLGELKTNFFVNSMLDLVQFKFEEIKKEKKKGERCEQCQENDNATSRLAVFYLAYITLRSGLSKLNQIWYSNINYYHSELSIVFKQLMMKIIFEIYLRVNVLCHTSISKCQMARSAEIF